MSNLEKINFNSKELIKITEQNGKQAVSARELYEFLGFDKSQWARWYQKNIIDNEFAFESIDYQVFDLMSNPNGGRPSKDFALSIEFAKKISMMARTERGEEARRYFIECEKRLKTFSNEDILLLNIIKSESAEQRALSLNEYVNVVVKPLKEQNQQMLPKAEFYDDVVESKDLISMSEVAKVLNFKNIGRNNMFEILRKEGFLRGNNEPYQEYVDRGYFKPIEVKWNNPKNGDVKITIKTMVSQKGLDYISKKLKSLGYKKNNK